MTQHKSADDPDALTQGYEIAVSFLRKRCESLMVQLRETQALLRELEHNGAHVRRARGGKRLSLAQIILQTIAAHGPALTLGDLHTHANALAGRTIPRPSLRVTVAKLIRAGKVARVGAGASGRFKAA